MNVQERQRIMDLGIDIYFKFVKQTLTSSEDADKVFNIGLILDQAYNKGYKDGKNDHQRTEK